MRFKKYIPSCSGISFIHYIRQITSISAKGKWCFIFYLAINIRDYIHHHILNILPCKIIGTKIIFFIQKTKQIVKIIFYFR